MKMVWYELYQVEFGVDIKAISPQYELQFKKIGKLKGDEIFAAIRALKAQDQSDQRWSVRRPGASDIVKQIKNARRQKVNRSKQTGMGRDCLISFVQTQLRQVHGHAEIFNAACSVVDSFGCYRELTTDEIKEVFRWAERQLGFVESTARAILGDKIAPLYANLRKNCDKLTEAWVKGDEG